MSAGHRTCTSGSACPSRARRRWHNNLVDRSGFRRGRVWRVPRRPRRRESCAILTGSITGVSWALPTTPETVACCRLIALEWTIESRSAGTRPSEIQRKGRGDSPRVVPEGPLRCSHRSRGEPCPRHRYPGVPISVLNRAPPLRERALRARKGRGRTEGPSAPAPHWVDEQERHDGTGAKRRARLFGRSPPGRERIERPAEGGLRPVCVIERDAPRLFTGLARSRLRRAVD